MCPKIAYRDFHFRADTLKIIEQAEQICREYAAQGFTLTLRQLYYQFVSRDLIPNKDSEYKRLGSIINDARLAGLLDWDYLEDRTRNLRDLAHWTSPRSILSAVAQQYRIDKWANQPYRPEVWIEKDALVGVIQGVCEANDVPYFSCRGYTSQSEVWGAAQRLLQYDQDQQPIILHLGDHDPSGIDMTRDITDRLEMFMSRGIDGSNIQIRRLALNFDQIQQYDPPPNPAKASDSRFIDYQRIHGDESWELDALEPNVIAGLIQTAINNIKDGSLWQDSREEEDTAKQGLLAVYDRYDDVQSFLNGESL